MAFIKKQNQNPEPAYTKTGKKPWIKNNLRETEETSQRDYDKIIALMEAYKIFLAIPDISKSKKLYASMLSEQDSYLDFIEFSDKKELKYLELNNRPAGRNLLKNIPPEFEKKLLDITTVDEAKSLLSIHLQKQNLRLEEFDFQAPIPADMRRVIRLDFNGAVEKPDEDILSSDYRNREKDKNVKPEDYDLTSCPAWQKFSTFESFRNLEGFVREALAFNGVSAQKDGMLSQMKVADFEDAMWNYKRAKNKEENPNSYVSTQAELFEGARVSFVKVFINNHENEFRDTLKEMGCRDTSIDWAVGKMQKGRLPKIQISGNRYMVPSVHHNHAIMDAGMLENPTLANDISNFRLMFDLRSGNLRQQDTRSFPSSKIALNENFDLNDMAKDEDKKKEVIKNLAAGHIDDIFYALTKMNLDKDKASNFILTMYKEGRIPVIETRPDHYVHAALKKTDYGMRFCLCEKENDKDQMRGMHKHIAHGIDGAPCSEEYSNKKHEVLAGEELNGKNTYDVSGLKSNNLKSFRKVITRIRSGKEKVMALFASFKKSISLTEQDKIDFKNRRQSQLQSGQEQCKNNNGVSREK